MFFLKVRRKKKEKVGLEEKDVANIIQKELAPYMTREELKEYLQKINEDEKKKKLWDSLSVRKRIKLLKYVAEKKGMQDGKK